MTELLPYFHTGYPMNEIRSSFLDDRENEIPVYISYSKDDPLCLAGVFIRPTKICDVEVIIKDLYYLDDYAVLFDAVRDAIRWEERNEIEIEGQINFGMK